MLCTSCGFDNPEVMTFCGACAAKLGSLSDNGAQKIALSADFVGRQREMGELVSALDDVIAGKGRLVMLVGEPGIGKTRLAQELAAIAGQRGAQILWGRCYEGEGAPPYWPWLQPLRAYVQQSDSDTLQSHMGAGAGDIAELVADVKERLPDVQPPPPLETPEQARFRLFNSITTFLKNAAQDQPIMLVLDDLHWADRSSLLLLEFLCRELESSHLLVLGTYRDMELSRGHPLAQSLGELTRERTFHRVLLRGLTHEDVGRYIEHASQGATAPELVDAVYAQSEGNPLFVGEMARLLVQEEGEWRGRIPEGIREVIGRRLDRLSEGCNRTLTVASVIGREFGLDQLDRLIKDISQDRLLDVLDEALSVRVIEELPDAVGRYQFTHALIQETLVNELSLTRRVRLHAQIAEILEEIYSDGLDAHAAELAHHYGQAEAMLGSEKLAHYSLRAGEQAISSNAYEEALVHFQRALTAKEGTGYEVRGAGSTTIPHTLDPRPQTLVTDAETATILFGLGRAQAATLAWAQAQEAIDTLRRAFDAFVDLGDIENAVAAAMHPNGLMAGSSGNVDMAARALGLVPPDSIEAGYLLSRYGSALSLENNDYEGAQENLDRAVEIARRERDRILEVHALFFIAHMHYPQGHYREVVEKILPVIELAQSLDELDVLVRARQVCVDALITLGNGNEAQIHATAGLEAAERLHNRSRLAQMLINNANLAILRGEWKVAQEFIARALAESPRDALALIIGALLNLQAGNLKESSEYINQALEVVPDGLIGAGINRASMAWIMLLSTRVTGTTELLDVAESAAREIQSSPSRPGTFISRNWVVLALIAIQRSDAESAKDQYLISESQRGTQFFAVICFDRLLGLLAQTMGKLDDSATHFEDALAFCRKAGYQPELAWSCYDYADMLLDETVGAHGRAPLPEDRHKAMQLLDEALSISTELGMRPLMEKVVALKEQVESQPAKAPAYPDGLTAREVEVLRLIAAGKSNRQIAEELVISVNTVIRHVGNIFGKTDVANRTEAASYANQNNLVS